jgi:hypothetical protein
MRSISRWLSLAALLPLLALAVSGFGYDRSRCLFSGEVMAGDCCASDDTGSGPAMEAVCCQHETVSFVRPPAEASGRTSAPLLAAVPVAILPARAALGEEAAPPAPAWGAALLRPPAVCPILSKQSFLI